MAPLARIPLALVLLAVLPACTEAEPKKYDPEEVVATAVDYEASLEHLNAMPIDTVHNDEMGFAEIYANDVAAEVFREIDGTDLGATAEFPRGSILTKVHYDENLEPLGVMTILAKFEEGYNPEANDWFFAMVTTEGEAIDGVIGNGPDVYFCFDCHQQEAAATDLVIPLAPDQLR